MSAEIRDNPNPPTPGSKCGDEDYLLEFYVRNDSTTPYPSATKFKIGEIPVTSGEWTRLVVYARPSHVNESNDGQVRVWKFDDEYTDSTQTLINWFGRFGYDPSNPNNFYADIGSPNPNSVFETMFGIYRSQQLNFQRVFFDAVKHSTTYASVIPRKSD